MKREHKSIDSRKHFPPFALSKLRIWKSRLGFPFGNINFICLKSRFFLGKYRLFLRIQDIFFLEIWIYFWNFFSSSLNSETSFCIENTGQVAACCALFRTGCTAFSTGCTALQDHFQILIVLLELSKASYLAASNRCKL